MDQDPFYNVQIKVITIVRYLFLLPDQSINSQQGLSRGLPKYR